ncbi:MAG: rhodanese-like domain-containing protein [Candidatus Hodarchaeales archaeon]
MSRTKIPFNFLLILFLLALYSSVNDYGSQATLLNGYTNISVTEAYNVVENTSSLFILDVRTQEEYSTGHIINAELIPHKEITLRQNELPENKSRPVLVYCHSGSRSVIASNSLVDLNFTMVYNMLEGFNAWKNAGYPYEASFIDPTEKLMQVLIVVTILGISTVIFFVILREFIKRKKIFQ